MSSEARKKRRRAEQKKEQGRIWGALAGLAVALVPSIVPRLPVVIATVLAVLWLASWRMARDGYKYHLSIKWAAVLMLVHGIIIAAIGYWIWPRITVGPSRVSFSGYPSETFNFSVRNGRADDVYDVQIPFFIGRNKHFEDKLSANVIGDVEPSGPLRDDYNYCYGAKGDGVVSHVQKNEQEVLIVRIPHLVPYSSGAFSITYTGGDKLPDIVPGAPDFIGEPYSYSPNSGTVGVRGDYRICKYVMSPSGK
jgi:hypothetical protein